MPSMRLLRIALHSARACSRELLWRLVNGAIEVEQDAADAYAADMANGKNLVMKQASQAN